MTADESDPALVGFLTDNDIVDIFEQDRSFSEELEPQSLARLNWMLTKHRVVFMQTRYY